MNICWNFVYVCIYFNFNIQLQCIKSLTISYQVFDGNYQMDKLIFSLSTIPHFVHILKFKKKKFMFSLLFKNISFLNKLCMKFFWFFGHNTIAIPSKVVRFIYHRQFYALSNVHRYTGRNSYSTFKKAPTSLLLKSMLY